MIGCVVRAGVARVLLTRGTRRRIKSVDGCAEALLVRALADRAAACTGGLKSMGRCRRISLAVRLRDALHKIVRFRITLIGAIVAGAGHDPLAGGVNPVVVRKMDHHIGT